MTLSNAEISRLYMISEAAVNGWIKAATENKNTIKLEIVNNKLKAIDSKHNRAEFKRLSEQAQKYKPNTSLKKVELSEDFYKIFSQDEILEIAKDLEIKKSVNLKFWYKERGAKVWDQIVKWRQGEIKSEISDLSFQSIAYLNYISGNNAVNLFDVGQGNGYPSKDFINYLKKEKRFLKYIPIDISQEMIDIALENLKDDLKGVPIVSYVRDFESTRFDTIFAENRDFKKQTGSIILMVGNTICNQDEQFYTFKNFRAGMEKEDLLLLTVSLDNTISRTDFKYIQYSPEDELKYAWHFKILGIDVEKCEINYYWDEENKRKVKTYILDKDYLINFKLYGQNREVRLNQGEQIIRWQHYLFDYKNISNLLNMADFNILSYQVDKTQQNALIVCGINS